MKGPLRLVMYAMILALVAAAAWYVGARGARLGGGASSAGGSGDDDGGALGEAGGGGERRDSGEGWQWDGWQRDTAPEGALAMEHDYYTLRPGESLELRGRVERCTDPEEFHERFTPCTLRWDLPGDETATGERVEHTFTEVGHHVVTLTARNGEGAPDLTPERLHVTVWEGEFRDDFSRQALDFDGDGWAPPIDPDLTEWRIDDGWLHVTRSGQVPGLTALTTWASARDAHIEVLQRRSQDVEGEHYTDIICRMHPVLLQDRFYRIRIWQMPPAFRNPTNNCISLTVFKMSPDRPGLGESSWPDVSRPHSVCSWPRDRDIRVVVDVVGRRFDMRLEDPARPGTALLEASWVDEAEDAFLYSGRWGVTEFDGETWFDDFLMREIRPSDS